MKFIILHGGSKPPTKQGETWRREHNAFGPFESAEDAADFKRENEDRLFLSMIVPLHAPTERD